MSNLQAVVIVVNIPEDQSTAVEAAAAAAVQSMQDSGVEVTAATFSNVSLLPSPPELLRQAVEKLRKLSKGRPSATDLTAAVAAVDEAAAVVEKFAGGLPIIGLEPLAELAEIPETDRLAAGEHRDTVSLPVEPSGTDN